MRLLIPHTSVNTLNIQTQKHSRAKKKLNKMINVNIFCVLSLFCKLVTSSLLFKRSILCASWGGCKSKRELHLTSGKGFRNHLLCLALVLKLYKRVKTPLLDALRDAAITSNDEWGVLTQKNDGNKVRKHTFTVSPVTNKVWNQKKYITFKKKRYILLLYYVR